MKSLFVGLCLRAIALGLFSEWNYEENTFTTCSAEVNLGLPACRKDHSQNQVESVHHDMVSGIGHRVVLF